MWRKFEILDKNNFTSWTINRYTIDKWMKFEKLFTKKVPVQLNGWTKALSTAETFSWNGKHGSQNTFFLVYSSLLFCFAQNCTVLFCSVLFCSVLFCSAMLLPWTSVGTKKNWKQLEIASKM